MTLEQIQQQISARKPVGRTQVYNYLKACRIKPIGTLRQRPQQYPEDAAEKILLKLGLQIVSMDELRDERRRAKNGLKIRAHVSSRKTGGAR